jgi:GNAT superfamily N-acetyltransferase
MGTYRRMVGEPFSWESQARQYPVKHAPGVTYFAGVTPTGTVDCLLYYGPNRRLWGVLNHYGQDFPPYEVAGNVNVFVDPARRRMGVGSALLREAWARWPFSADQQRYSEAGEALVRRLLDDPLP